MILTLVVGKVLILMVSLGSTDDATKHCANYNCTSAEEILLSRNLSVDACTDFYKHACGDWTERNLVRDSPERRQNTAIDTEWKVDEKITELIENITSSDIAALRKAKQFYEACMDWDAINARGLAPLEAIIGDNGFWPLITWVPRWTYRTLPWQNIHENLAKRVGFSTIFDIFVDVDRSNSSGHILYLRVPRVPSQGFRSYIRTKRDTKKDGYWEYIIDVVMGFMQSNGSQSSIGYPDIESMLTFEDELEKLANRPYEDDNDLLRTTVQRLQNDWDFALLSTRSIYTVNWRKTVEDRFAGTGIEINYRSDIITVMPGNFAEKLARILADTDPSTIVNYMLWNVIHNLMPLTISQLNNPPRADFSSDACIDKHKMPHAVAYLYAKKYFNGESERAALEVIGHVRKEIKWEIDHCSWLDNATKLAAREMIEDYLGYPDWYDQPGKMDEYYKSATIGTDHFENVLALNRLAAKQNLLKLRNLVVKKASEWDATAPNKDKSFYKEIINSINVTLTNLQSPFFFHEGPPVVNYGGFGAAVGNEIVHGFDNDGAKRGLWENILYEREKNTRSVQQVLAENIADTMAIRAALKAYQMAKTDREINNTKPEYFKDFTDEQLYFYAFTHSLCEVVPDEHSPNRLRVIGTVSNMQEFADAFKCPAGSPMNPTKKCLIWD